MIKRIVICALLPMIMLISGCFEIKNEIWIHSDGGGKVLYDMGLPEAMLPNDTAKQEFLKKIQDEITEAKQDPNIISADLRSYKKEGLFHIEVIYELKDITKIDAAKKKTRIAKDNKSKSEFMKGLTIKRLPSGNIKVTQTFENMQKKTEKASDNPMVQAMFGGRYMTLIVHGNIVSSNGNFSQDGQTVHWKVPMAEVLNATADSPLCAEVSTGGFFSKSFLIIAGIITAGLFFISIPVIILIVFLSRMKRKK